MAEKKQKSYVDYLENYFGVDTKMPMTGQEVLKDLAADLLDVISILNSPLSNIASDEELEKVRSDRLLANTIYGDLNNYANLEKEQIKAAKELIKKYLKKG